MLPAEEKKMFVAGIERSKGLPRQGYNSPGLCRWELRAAQTGEAPMKRGPTVPPGVRQGPPAGPAGPRRARGVAGGSR